jgi:hypothetical protein
MGSGQARGDTSETVEVDQSGEGGGGWERMDPSEEVEWDLKERWVGGSLRCGVGGWLNRERAGEGRGLEDDERVETRDEPQGRGSHQVRLDQVTLCTSQERSSATSSLP